MRTHAVGSTIVALGAALLLAGLSACAGRGHMEGTLTFPPREQAPGPLEEPPLPGSAEPLPPTGRPLPEPSAPVGIYFLHEAGYGLERCVLIGERVTGSGRTGSLAGEQARARAVLDLADQAQWMGGNVVLLPHFQEDFHAGRLQGRVYRCDEAQRRDIYERAAADEALTVVPR